MSEPSAGAAPQPAPVDPQDTPPPRVLHVAEGGTEESMQQTLQVLHGVLLSASVGAFAAAGAPLMLLNSMRGKELSVYWLLVAMSTIVIAFDAWYQFTINGRLIVLKGWSTAILIVAMVWTSFLPFQFLARNLNSKDYAFLNAEPVSTLFEISLIATLLVQCILMLIVAWRLHNNDVAQIDNRMIVLGHKPAFVAGVRVMCLFAIVVASLAWRYPEDTIGRIVWLMVVWLLFRLIETLVAFLCDKGIINTGGRG